MVALAKLSFSIPLLDVENLETINGRNPLNLRCLHTANISVSSKSHCFYLLDHGDMKIHVPKVGLCHVPMDLSFLTDQDSRKSTVVQFQTMNMKHLLNK